MDNQFHDGIDFGEEIDSVESKPGFFKVYKFGLYVVSLFQQIGKIPVTETMLIAIPGEANFLHCS